MADLAADRTQDTTSLTFHMGKSKNMKNLVIAAAILATLPAAASAQTANAPQTTQKTPLQSTVSVYGGFTAPTDGYEDRFYVGANMDEYVGDLGVHLDVSGVTREQDGAFASIGLSKTIASGVRGKLAFGGSTDNRNILPQYFGLAQLRIEAGSKTVLTPALAYRRFRTGVDEYLPSLDVAHYFSVKGDQGGYYVAQGRAAIAILPGRTAPSFGAGVTTVRNSGFSAGIYAEAGRLSYANLIDIGAPGVNSPFFAIRPSFGARISDRTELFVRGEYSHNDFFDTRGAMVGVKFKI